MNKKEEFKIFASKHPELSNFIKNGEMTWQKFYEIYDIYGENNEAWESFFKTKESRNTSLNELPKFIKNIDMDSIQKHINTAQKALGVIQELTSKPSSTNNITNTIKGPSTARPINKFFED